MRGKGDGKADVQNMAWTGNDGKYGMSGEPMREWDDGMILHLDWMRSRPEFRTLHMR
jgi:hypothetical protein